ncbi:MAG: hypothetical protein JWN43_2589 [Gammaproteobacteria bacterium]|nr:hypothetical protein [Gammaproteobacteria bacterium]
MNNLLDDLMIGLVLLASVTYVAFSLGPRALRPRLLGGVSGLLLRLPRGSRLRGLARRLESAAKTKAGGCSGCDNCGAEQPPAARVAPPEIRVPVAKIGRR